MTAPGGQRISCSASAALASFSASPIELDEIFAIMIVQPVADLIARRRWREVLCLDRWRVPDVFPGVPSAKLKAKSGTVVSACRSQQPLDLHSVDVMISALRRWAPKILASVEDDEERCSEQLVLEQCALWLFQFRNRFSPLLEPSSGTLCRDHAAIRNQKFSSSRLVASVLFGWHLRDNVGLTAPLTHAFDFVVPGWIPGSCLSDGSYATISRSIVRSSQIAVDLALMRVRSKSLMNEQRPAARFGWADSSPISKTDWLISKHQVVPGHCLVAAYNASVRLVPGYPGYDANPERRAELCTALWHHVNVLTHPP
eukprot:9478078-Pyramimonas_sp.AAC.1